MNLFSNKKIGGLPLFLFRIGFGITALISSFSMLRRVIIHAPLRQETYHFPAIEWAILPTPYLIGLALLMIIGSIGIMSGYRFKYACLAFTLPYSYIFLVRLNNFNNHYYLIILIGLLLLVTDADKKISLSSTDSPSSLIPKWQLDILQFQVIIPYIFSGLHKLLNSDWRSGNALLNQVMEYSFFPRLISPLTQSMIASNIGALIDLCIAPLLIFKKTRPLATITLILFHITNKWILYSGLSSLSSSIGVFPILGIISIVVFWEEDQLLAGIKKIQTASSKFLTPSIQLKSQTTTIIKPYLTSLLLIIIALLPLYYYIAKPNFRWDNTIFGTWAQSSFKANSGLNIYYQHNQTGEWILFHPSQPLLPPQEKALLTPHGVIAVTTYIDSQMKSKGLYTSYIGIGYTRKFNNTDYKILDQIIPWEDLTTETVNKAINKTYFHQ